MIHDQHFMIDEKILNLIAAYARDKVVTEIGGGTGNLSKKLAAVAKKLIIIEKDPKMCEILTTKVSAEIRHEDAQTAKLTGMIIGNIPYGISEQFFYRLVREARDVSILTVGMNFAELLQNEKTKLGIYTKIFFELELLETVSPEAFDPAPKVWSAVIKLTPKFPKILLAEIIVQTDKKLKNAIIESLTKRGKTQKESREIIKKLDNQYLDTKIIRLSNEEFIEVFSELTQQLPQYDVSEETSHTTQQH